MRTYVPETLMPQFQVLIKPRFSMHAYILITKTTLTVNTTV